MATFWFLPHTLAKDAQGKALVRKELLVPAEGLPSLSRAESWDQIAQWLKKLHPDMPPERIAPKAQSLWQMGHMMGPEDYVVVPLAGGTALMMGEVLSHYNYGENGVHAWRVNWVAPHIQKQNVTGIETYTERNEFFEITDPVLMRMHHYVPSLKRPVYTVFKWVSIAILVFELIYFWPR